MTAMETREQPSPSSSTPASHTPAARTPACRISQVGPAHPLTLTLVQECEVVTHGVRRLLQPFSDRVQLTDGVASCESVHQIVLFDCFPMPGQIGRVMARPRPAYARGRVVAYSWETRAGCVDAAKRHGFDGYLGKSLPGAELVAALEAVASSADVVWPRPEPDGAEPLEVVWPGEDQQLTPREGEVVGLITHGVSNAEVAALLHLSLNSVKSYIRSAYRKMGVSTRAQAVLWGLAHGFGSSEALHAGTSEGGRHEVPMRRRGLRVDWPRGWDQMSSRKTLSGVTLTAVEILPDVQDASISILQADGRLETVAPAAPS